ncbi:1-acyl-sn-glycerol-3-phosphate acyltransferase [Alteromonas sp. MB-3u-76]|uniref:1-acylglycerol-3-phosphate O-acyltransferase n=1 Tax=unclassified Alteromonas TaxID=2614992 RepID=UPI000903B413|nr:MULTISPECIES: 1-acylglycerol-3-phosphate O-acyltransferase [unclassified Alteromonas]APE06867.1 1-acyl-sn-glycerol-3-phosphate acyltransferase [Alteromonas sp. RW2A1]AUC89392.1 1-acyl-sn-glycerol-3-phosphate acyltransferase [Alteromonas sp. MB-3u-76]
MIALLRIPILFIAFLVINVILLFVFILRPFHKDNVQAAGALYSQMAKIVGLKVIVRRDPAVKLNEPYVFIANHQNSFDIMTICKAALPGVVTIGKKSLKWIPIFGQIYWLSGNIMIDRNNSGKARNTLDIAANRIAKKKTSVWLFPEGTRSNGRGILPFKQGAFRLAKTTNEPVVMVTASNLHKKVRWNKWDNGVVLIDISAPQPLTETHSIKEWMGIFNEQMKEKFEQLNAQVDELEKSR